MCTTFRICMLFVFFNLSAVFADGPLKPLVIGLDADLTGSSLQAGQSISRGISVAIHEINDRGGVLGRPLFLKTLDHRGNPLRARDNMLEFSETPELVAVVGGLHTPAALEVLPLVHEKQIPFLIPWAAGTTVVENGYQPNFVFRVSVRDSYAGKFLVGKAVERGFRRLGLLLENTGWGRSNQSAMITAAAEAGLPEPHIQWVNWGAENVTAQLEVFKASNIEAVLLVANPPEGLVFIKELAKTPDPKPAVLSHWGITGGNFFSEAADELKKVDVSFLYTFTFCGDKFQSGADALFKKHSFLFPEFKSPLEVPATPGLAHAYDLIHLLAIAIENAGSSDRVKIRYAMENIDQHTGVMKEYKSPFTKDNHDALSIDYLILARYDDNGNIIPIK